MALEITVRDQEKRTEDFTTLCKCALLVMNEEKKNGGIRTVTFAGCDALSIGETVVCMEREIEKLMKDPDVRRAVEVARWMLTAMKREDEKKESAAQELDDALTFAVKVTRVPRNGGER